jgi:hypothetical protein
MSRHTTSLYKPPLRTRSQSQCALEVQTSWYSEHCARPTSLDVQFVDYDGVRFHLSTPERKTLLLLSMSIRCWDELVKYGALDVLKREYGSLVKAQAEPDYNASLEIDLEQVPLEEGLASFQSLCRNIVTRISQRLGTLSSNRSLSSNGMCWRPPSSWLSEHRKLWTRPAVVTES